MARTFQWQSGDGRQLLTLNAASGYRLQDATTGLTAPTYRLPTEQYAGTDGVRVQSVSADGRDVTLAMLVQGATRDEFRSRVRTLVAAMRPKLGPGTLVCTDETGSTRTLTCYYTGGLEGNEARGTALAGRWWKAAVKLLAEDPWWYGDAVIAQVGLGDAPSFFPILPVRLQRSDLAGSLSVNNVGDEDAYPLWTVTGPGTGLTLTNNATGQSIGLSTVLVDGESLTIDTRPFLQSVIKSNGSNLFGDLLTDPAMWPLTPGMNDVTVALGGAGPASRVAASYRPRYAGAS